MNDVHDIISKFKALDREEKFKIINLISKEGEKSITDVRKQLNMSFSTTHKYLNELENSGILESKVEAIGGRQKKLYSLQDFKIVLDPLKLSNLDGGTESVSNAIRIVNSQGLTQDMETERLRKTFVEVGIPLRVSELILEKIFGEMYHGMSISELQSIVLRILSEERTTLDNAMRKLSSNGFFGDQSLPNIMKKQGLDAPFNMYINGDIDIYNIGIPRPISISHDLRMSLKHGITRSSQMKNLNDISNNMRTLIEIVHKEAMGPQTFNHLNVFLAPFVKKEIYPRLLQVIGNLTGIYPHVGHIIGNTSLYFNIDLSIPDYLKKEPAIGPDGKEVGVYGDYEAEAEKVAKAILETIGTVKYPQVVINLNKGWNKSGILNKIEEASKENLILVANLTRPWNKCASYFHKVMRLDQTVRTGNCQTVTINFPRIAWQVKNEAEFFEKLRENMAGSLDILTTSAESIGSKFYTSFSFLPKKFGNDKYYDLEDSTYAVCTSGLNEAVRKLVGSELHESKAAQDFVLKTLKIMKKEIKSRKSPCKIGIAEHMFKPVLDRFAKKDLKDFGKEIFHRGSKENPTYTPGTSVSENAKISLREKIKIEEQFHSLQTMGHMSILKKDKGLMNILKKVSKSDIGYAGIV